MNQPTLVQMPLLSACCKFLLYTPGSPWTFGQLNFLICSHICRLPGKRATLLLGSASSKAFGVKTLEFYVSRGVMTRAESLHDLALDANLPMVRRRAQLPACLFYQSVTTGADHEGPPLHSFHLTLFLLLGNGVSPVHNAIHWHGSHVPPLLRSAAGSAVGDNHVVQRCGRGWI
jgi:hypothetical protein